MLYFEQFFTPDIYPSGMQLGIASLTFMLAYFHKQRSPFNSVLTENEVKYTVDFAEKKVGKGLMFDRGLVDKLDYESLEKQAGNIQFTEENTLLQAVASAVAEAGPWDMSIGQVAKQANLSKSSLYSHFKNKQDMLKKLFATEFEHIITIIEMEKQRSTSQAEQFYMVIIGIADYLRSRKEILAAIDWLRTRHTHIQFPKEAQELHPKMGYFIELFAEYIPKDSEYLDDEKTLFPHWLVFLIVNILMSQKDKLFSEISNYSFPRLYRFVTLGIDGLVL
jgi:AcrR family transcriptional regulator